MLQLSSNQFVNGVSNVGSFNSGSNNSANAELAVFWTKQVEKIEQMDTAMIQARHDSPELPLARIKKIMKLDEDVKLQMISAEAPVLFAKAAELFIEELTLRAWVHTEDNKRKTLQKNDIAMAISKYDMFDFLIDIVPREEIRSVKKSVDTILSSAQQSNQAIPLSNDQLQFLLQSAQQGGEGHIQSMGQPIQLQCANQMSNIQIISTDDSAGTVQQVAVQPQTSMDQQTNDSQPQVFQQVVGPDGSVQHIPIQLSQAQLQFLKMQFPTNNLPGGSSQQVQQPSVQIQSRSSAPSQQQSNFVLASPIQQQQSTMQMQTGSQPIFIQQSPTQQNTSQPQIIQLPFGQFGGQQVLVPQQLASGQTVYVPMHQSGMQSVQIQQQQPATTTTS